MVAGGDEDEPYEYARANGCGVGVSLAAMTIVVSSVPLFLASIGPHLEYLFSYLHTASASRSHDSTLKQRQVSQEPVRW